MNTHFDFHLRGCNWSTEGFSLPGFLRNRVSSLVDRRDPGDVVAVPSRHINEEGGLYDLLKAARSADLAFGWFGRSFVVVIDRREPIYWDQSSITPELVMAGSAEGDLSISAANAAAKFFLALKKGLEMRRGRLAHRDAWLLAKRRIEKEEEAPPESEISISKAKTVA